ncbi:MAG: hypothetical protein ACYC4H_11255, partial [Desulfocucumaceae bacterium]
MDLLLVNAGYIIAFHLKFFGEVPLYNFSAYYATWPWLSLTAIVLLYFYRLYGPYRWRWTE